MVYRVFEHAAGFTGWGSFSLTIKVVEGKVLYLCGSSVGRHATEKPNRRNVVAKLIEGRIPTIMKITKATIILTLIFLSSCANRETNKSETDEIKDHFVIDAETPIKLLSLQTELDKIIDRDDSLKNIRTTHFGSASFWIVFNKLGDDCYLTIIDQIAFYDSSIMIGYFKHRDRYISVYGNRIECGENFIDFEKLSTGKIHYIIDFSGDNEGGRMPFPYQDYGFEYLINEDSLLLKKSGMVECFFKSDN